MSYFAIPGTEEGLGRFLADEALPKLFDRPGVVSVHFGVADRSGSEIVTTERKARGDLTHVPGCGILLEAVSVSAAAEASCELAAFEAHGVQGPPEQATYRFGVFARTSGFGRVGWRGGSHAVSLRCDRRAGCGRPSRAGHAHPARD